MTCGMCGTYLPNGYGVQIPLGPRLCIPCAGRLPAQCPDCGGPHPQPWRPTCWDCYERSLAPAGVGGIDGCH